MPIRNSLRGCGLAGTLLVQVAAADAANVITYHNDTFRTGWNAQETSLTPASVSSASFGLIAQARVDGQVDATPLIVQGVSIAGVTGVHDVAYVVTSNDTLYAIDANTGHILAHSHFGIAPKVAALPGRCDNNASNVGISSTPVYDPSTATLYLIAYAVENGALTYRIHAVDGSTLADKVPSQVIAAQALGSDGVTLIPFNAAVQRQRAALVEANGNIYAGFADFCDVPGNGSRGWVLGWSAATLQPLATPKLINTNLVAPKKVFFSSVWMSGYGIAADAAGTLFFVTGNSDPTGTTYDQVANLEESVVNLSPDLATVAGFFTPNDPHVGQLPLDLHDLDFGAGGIMLIPDQSGSVPHLAVAAGKSGPFYLLNRDRLGGFAPPSATLGTYVNDGCWCGPSYFVGADAVPRVVESTGRVLRVWTLSTAPAPALTLESTSGTLATGQDAGFFTSVSSNGTNPGTAIIWAVTRPQSSKPGTVTLQAFDPAHGAATLYSGAAGTWPRAGSSNANIVPVVANGHVYVASYFNLSIFGLTSGKPAAFVAPPPPDPETLPPNMHHLHGIARVIGKSSVVLKLRDGSEVTLLIDTRTVRMPSNGGACSAIGTYVAPHRLRADSVLRLKSQPATWDDDL